MNRQIETLTKQKKFAWGKVFEGYEREREVYEKVAEMKKLLVEQSEIPKHFIDLFEEMAVELKRRFNCPICLEDVEKGKYKVSCCGHIYCNDCFKRLMEDPEPKCALCRKKLG